MADPSLPPSDYLGLAAWLIGAGGGATLLAGIGKYLFGPKDKALEAPAPIPPPIAPLPPPIDETMPTHFVSHYLLKGDVDHEAMKKAIDSVVAAVTNLSMQVNTIGALLERERKDRNQRARKR